MRALLLGLLLLPAAMPLEVSAQDCRAIGSSYFCSDGRAGQRSRALTPRRDPTETNRLGNNRYTDDATDAHRNNNALFQQRKQRERRIGNTIFNSDGSRCDITGNRLKCY